MSDYIIQELLFIGITMEEINNASESWDDIEDVFKKYRRGFLNEEELDKCIKYYFNR